MSTTNPTPHPDPADRVAQKTVLITGANAGLGKEVARQLALRADTAKIYLGCRNESRAIAAKTELEAATRKSIFEIVNIDMTDLTSVRSAVAAIPGPIDALIMNAGGNGGKTPSALTQDGVTTVFAANVLGHVVLLEELINHNKLTDVALYVGSEAARGIPKFRMKRPAFASTSADELASVINGSYFPPDKFNTALAYGQTKYIAALWMSAMAREHPELRLITVSPGSTAGTNGLDDLPRLAQIVIKDIVMKFIGPALGVVHPLPDGAQRLVEGITDPHLRTGVFYASKANTITGPMINQAEIFPDLENPTYQDNADQAIHRFIT